MGKEARAVCPWRSAGLCLAHPQEVCAVRGRLGGSLQLLPSPSAHRLGTGLLGHGQLQRWVLGCMGFALDLFWGGYPLPLFHSHIKSLSS